MNCVRVTPGCFESSTMHALSVPERCAIQLSLTRRASCTCERQQGWDGMQRFQGLLLDQQIRCVRGTCTPWRRVVLLAPPRLSKMMLKSDRGSEYSAPPSLLLSSVTCTPSSLEALSALCKCTIWQRHSRVIFWALASANIHALPSSTTAMHTAQCCTRGS